MDTNEKKIKISITVPEDLIRKIDLLASKQYQNRSAWIISSIVEALKKKENEEQK